MSGPRYVSASSGPHVPAAADADAIKHLVLENLDVVITEEDELAVVEAAGARNHALLAKMGPAILRTIQTSPCEGMRGVWVVIFGADEKTFQVGFSREQDVELSYLQHSMQRVNLDDTYLISAWCVDHPLRSTVTLPRDPAASKKASVTKEVQPLRGISPPSSANFIWPQETTANSSSAAPYASVVESPLASLRPQPVVTAEKKAKSFLMLLKLNSKKQGATLLTQDEMTSLTELASVLTAGADSKRLVRLDAAAIIDRLLQRWPAALQYPVLALLHLLVLRKELAAHYASTPIVSLLLHHNDASLPASAQAMTMSTLANLLTVNDAARAPGVWDRVQTCMGSEDMHVRLAAATFIYNWMLLSPKHYAVAPVTTLLVRHVTSEKNSDVLAHLLRALLEAATDNSIVQKLLLQMDVASTLEDVKRHFSSDTNVNQIADCIIVLLATAQVDEWGLQ